jgi:hypothetical protein
VAERVVADAEQLRELADGVPSLFVPGTNNAASEEAAMCKERERRDSNPRPPA